MNSKERLFTVNGYKLAAKEWNNNAAIKVIALHGWLDNAASFDYLAPVLSSCHIVALDLAGHGFSDHKPVQATYNIWDDLLDILAVADEMGWHDFTLIGHSRGAIMSMLLTAAAPERIIAQVLLDGIWAQSIDVQDTAKQLSAFLVGHRAAQNKKPNIYQSISDAVDMRIKATAMKSNSAKTIVDRGLKANGDGYIWRSDPRLLMPSAFKMTAEHNHVLTNSVKSPTMLLLAGQGLGAKKTILEKLKQYPVIQSKILPGSHHFHMEEQAGDIAECTVDFLKNSYKNKNNQS